MIIGELAPWLVAIVAAFSFFLQLLMSIRNGTWNQAEREAKLAQEFTKVVNSLRKEMNEGFDTITTRFGETVQSIRTHVHTLEVTVAREMLNKSEFFEFNRATQEALQAIDEKSTARLDRQDARMETLNERINSLIALANDRRQQVK